MAAGLLAGCATGPLAPLRYEFVDDAGGVHRPATSRRARRRRRCRARPGHARGRTCARSPRPRCQGRLRGSEGGARARAYLVGRLQSAGLAPLFDGRFEQPTWPDGGSPAPHGVNVGAIYRAASADADWVVLVAHYRSPRGDPWRGARRRRRQRHSVALLLALGDTLGRLRPPVRRHVVLLFPDAEEPPDIRTERMGSSWFWQHPPLPLHRLYLALVLDSWAGALHRSWPRPASATHCSSSAGRRIPARPASCGMPRPSGRRSGPVEPADDRGVPVRAGFPVHPPSDYHGLREHGRRPFLFLTTGRTEMYHTPADTPDTLDYRAARGRRALGDPAGHPRGEC